MAYSTTTAKQSFILTNMTPQAKKLNQVGWAQLEKQIRTWVKQPDFGPLFVYTGPIHYQHKSRERKTIGPNKVWVPNAYFKVIYAPHKVSGQKTIAFIMPNQSVKKNEIHQYKTSIDDVEKKTEFMIFLPTTCLITGMTNWNRELTQNGIFQVNRLSKHETAVNPGSEELWQKKNRPHVRWSRLSILCLPIRQRSE